MSREAAAHPRNVLPDASIRPAVRAVLFDMDGVLVDSYEAWFHLVNAAARDLGYPPIDADQFRKMWGQGVDLDVEILFTRHTVPEIEGYYDRHFPDHAQHVQSNPQAGPMFDELRTRGVGVAVITNTPRSIAQNVLERAGLVPHVLVGGTDVPRGKPAPDMVLRALEVLRVGREEALLVGDSAFDRDAASASGVRFVHYGIAGDGALGSLLEVLRMLD